MRRHALGIISLVLLVAFGIMWWRHGWQWCMESVPASVCMRAGAVLFAIWLAFPQVTDLLKRVPGWLLACIGVAIMVLIAYPRSFFWMIPLFAAIALVQFIGWVFKPLPPKKRNRKAAEKAKEEKG